MCFNFSLFGLLTFTEQNVILHFRFFVFTEMNL